MTNDDWRDLPAGPALDRIVAVKAGNVPEKYHDELLNSSVDGNVLRSADFIHVLYVLPYSTDIGAALGLPKPDDVGLDMKIHLSGTASAMYYGYKDYARHFADGLALAVTRAWLAYMEQEAQDD